MNIFEVVINPNIHFFRKLLLLGLVTTLTIQTVHAQTAFREEWQRMYNGTATNTDGGKAISIDINGDIIVAGNTTDSITGLDFV